MAWCRHAQFRRRVCIVHHGLPVVLPPGGIEIEILHVDKYGRNRCLQRSAWNYVILVHNWSPFWWISNEICYYYLISFLNLYWFRTWCSCLAQLVFLCFARGLASIQASVPWFQLLVDSSLWSRSNSFATSSASESLPNSLLKLWGVRGGR